MAIIKITAVANIGPNSFSKMTETKEIADWSSFCKNNHINFPSTAFTKRNRRRLN